mmetsp:Transcript_103912/g.179505  ORF Transcript_103912/g.179505 Transcript_103912/m.179505 type:complete len:293 (+) Transcript_103912:72-950(+)
MVTNVTMPVTWACTSEEPVRSWPLQQFENDDACGDIVYPLGPHLSFQTFNALSASLFVMAGAHLLWKADTPMARGYGFMMCCVGTGSFSFHATGSLVSFMIDIVPMAVTAAMMLFRAVHGLQAEAGHKGSDAETVRWCIAMGASFVAVYLPWVAMQAGLSHYKVWGLWAFLFGSMGVVFAAVAFALFLCEGVLWGKGGRDLAISIACILLGLGCTIHSFIPGLCSGWRTQIPVHALWHLFSSITANRLGYILDMLTKLVWSMESDTTTPSRKKQKPLLLRMVADALPSQFSM